MPYAYEAGLIPWQIGRLTPGELINIIQAYHRRTITAAWWSERFAREERLKKLQHYVDEDKKSSRPIEEVRQEYFDLKSQLGRVG